MPPRRGPNADVPGRPRPDEGRTGLVLSPATQALLGLLALKSAAQALLGLQALKSVTDWACKFSKNADQVLLKM